MIYRHVSRNGGNKLAICFGAANLDVCFMDFNDGTVSETCFMCLFSVNSKNRAIRLESFTNVNLVSDIQRDVVKIFASLQSGDLPVLGAKVFATIHK